MKPAATDRRHFLSWRRPLLPQAVDFLAGDWRGDGPLDLSRLLVIVPTRQAGRRLREALADFAVRHGQGVFAPRVLTPEGLLGTANDAAVASRLDSLLAWVAVLRDLAMEEFREVFPKDPPARNFGWALRLAREFSGLQAALAEGALLMGDVLAKTDDGFPERQRWRELGELAERHAAVLARAGLKDAQTARIAAAARPAPAGSDRVVVLATPDPLPLALTVLAAHASTMPVSVAVFAPAEEKGNFDDWGRPVSAAWAHRELRLPEFETHVHLCAGPVAQAERLAAAARKYAQPEGFLAFGIADPEIAPPLEGELVRSGIPVFDPDGRPRKQDGLCQLLAALSGMAHDPVFENVEALARCPDFFRYLRQRSGGNFSLSDWLDGLDRLRDRHLPADLATALKYAEKPGNRVEVANGLRAMVALRDLWMQGTFEQGATAMLSEIFRDRRVDPRIEDDVRFESAAIAWTEIVRSCVQARGRFGDLDPADWWDLALGLLAENVRTDDKPRGALELQGWLELAWENAPHLMVAGLNDGRVPDAVAGDAFLPESLRARLGLKTNAGRLARDAYLLQTLAASRETGGRLDLLYGKTSLAGEPLRPSRLLLHCPDARLPGRVAFLFRSPDKDDKIVPWTRAWRLKPRREKPPTRVAVTGLKSWLNCPFRFYLGSVLKMQAVDPLKNELDALDFGTLCHGALEGLAGAAMRDCTDEGMLRDFLLGDFDRRMRERYGAELSLPLLVQAESARQRLAKAAEVQARERADGWVVVEVEKKIEIDFDGLIVSGRIDRIERHEKTGEVRVLDYKTSDTAVSPREAHVRPVRAGEAPQDWARVDWDGRERVWSDLQLPLYRHALAAEYGPQVGCAYFNLPKAVGETGLLRWEGFPIELQESAMRCARGACAAIKAGIFWPPNENVRPEYDDFLSLFQHGVADNVEWEAAR